MKLRRVFMVMLLAVAMIVTACSSGANDQPANDNQNQNGEQAGGSGEPKYGGVYRMAIGAAAPMLDPHKTSSINTHNLIGLVYSKLVTYKTGEGTEYTDYEVVPDLAEDWEMSEDGMTYTFYLRDAKWQNVPPVNGREVVAEDVVATMERIRSLPGHQAYMLEAVESIEAKDDKTVVFKLKQPFSPFLMYMANHFMWILPKEAIDGEIDLTTQAIGSGPFILESWDQTTGEAKLKKNPDYFEEGLPYLDGVEFVRVPDQSARIAAFRTGQLEVLSNLSPEEMENIKRTNPDVQVKRLIFATQTQVFMNMQKEPFNDLRVRKAISMAIDKESMVNTIFVGGEVSAPVNPSLGDWALPLEEREKLQPYDPEQAKQLLAEAGYPNGFKTKLMVTDAYGEQLIRAAQWIAADLKEIGIEAEIEVTEYATYYTQKWPNLEYDMAVGWQTYFQEPDEWLRSQLHTQGPKNWFGISDPELDKMLDQQRLILDQNERKEYVHEIQRYVLENVVNPIPTVTHYLDSAYQPWVRGASPHASYGNLHLKHIWLDK